MNWNAFFITVFIIAGLIIAHITYPEAHIVLRVMLGILLAYAFILITNMTLDIVDEVKESMCGSAIAKTRTVILKKAITMEQFDKCESIETTADIPLFNNVVIRIIHDFKKYPNGVIMMKYWIVDGKEDLTKRDADFISYNDALRIINKIIKSDATVEAVKVKSLKGFKLLPTVEKKLHS